MLKQMNQHDAGGGALRQRPTFTTGTVTLPPGGMKSLGLGVYNNQDPEPHFGYTCSAGMEDFIGASLDRLNLPGQPKYMLLYQFHNYGPKECRIDVARK
jgi:hypothetical protein